MNFAVIGSPIEHTLSPAIHNANFRALGLEDTYRALHVTPDDLRHVREIINQYELDGFNVTIPHKETIMQHLDETDPRALEVEAVNTVMVKGDRLIGFNTDVTGYKQAYTERFGGSPRKVLILGGGGASKAVFRAHREIGDDITIYARRKASFDTFRDQDFSKLSGFDDIGHFDVIINTTPVGLKNEDLFDMMNFPKSVITEDTIGIDLIYNPHLTPFLGAFHEEKRMNGLAMLVNQGLHAFEIWHDHAFKGNYEAVYKELNRKFGGDMK